MVNKWDIYFCCLETTIGSEQRGTRPVLVISTNSVNHNLPVSTVLPLSSINTSDKIYPTEVMLETAITGLPKLSVAMVQQIRTVSHNRLRNLAGRIIDLEIQNQVLDACRNYFDL